MAYDPDFNPAALIAQNIGGTEGMRWFGLYWTDTIATVMTPGYISNALELGMRAGDGFRYKDTNRGEWCQYDLIVGQINADGSADLAFAEQPEEAYPTSIVDPEDADDVTILGFVNGRLERLSFGEFQRTTSIVRIEQFAAIGEDITDDVADAWDAAVAYCHANKAILSFRPNQVYRSSRKLAATDMNLTIIGNNARIERAADGPDDFTLLEVSATITNIRTVTSVANDVIDYSDGTSGNSRVSKIDMGSALAAASYAVGQECKIAGTDFIPSSTALDYERIGECFTIGAISGQYIYTKSPLVETYTSGIRLGILGTARVHIEDLEIGDEDGSPDERRSTLAQFIGLVDARIRMFVRDSLSEGIEEICGFRGNYSGCRAVNVRTVTTSTPNTFGYLIVTGCGSTAGVYNDLYGEDVRHVITTRARKQEVVGTDAYHTLQSGGCVEPSGDNIHGHDCQNSAADFHSDVIGGHFTNIRRTGSHQGPSAASFACQLRGRRCFIDGLYSTGLNLLTVKMIGNDGDHVVRNMKGERSDKITTTQQMIRIDAAESATPGRISLQGEVRVSTGFRELLTLDNVDLRADSDLLFDYGYQGDNAPSADDQPIVVLVTDSRVRGKFGIDFSRSNTANTENPVIFKLDAADAGASDIAVKGWVRCAESGDNYWIADMLSKTGRAVWPDLDAQAGLPSNTNGGFLNGGSATVYCTPTRNQGTSTDRRDVTNTFGVTGAQAYSFSMYGYEFFTHRVKASVAGVQITNLPAGVVDGQLFAFANNLDGPVESIVLVNGNRLALGANVTLVAYASVLLQWSLNTAVWRPVGRFTP